MRLDFLVFCEFDLGDAPPNNTTICHFRNPGGSGPGRGGWPSQLSVGGAGPKGQRATRGDYQREHHRGGSPSKQSG